MDAVTIGTDSGVEVQHPGRRHPIPSILCAVAVCVRHGVSVCVRVMHGLVGGHHVRVVDRHIVHENRVALRHCHVGGIAKEWHPGGDGMRAVRHLVAAVQRAAVAAVGVDLVRVGRARLAVPLEPGAGR